jgi:ketosteroid isomerase-like protein
MLTEGISRAVDLPITCDVTTTQRGFVVVTALYNSPMTEPADVARAYFAGVTAHDPDAIQACFADDAELITNTGTYRGAEAIGGFYRDTLLQADDVRPDPGPLIVDGNRVAVEIDLLRGGRHIAVGDFFTIDSGKIRRLVIFFGSELT